MSTLTRLSASHTTVVPAGMRREMGLEPGDQLEWELHDDELRVRRRKRMTLDDICGIISCGGDAVKDGDRMYDEMW